MADLSRLQPPNHLTEDDRQTVFLHFFARLASYRDKLELYALAESNSSLTLRSERFEDIDKWAQELLEKAWVAYQEPYGGSCPTLDALADTSIDELPKLPATEDITKIMNTVLFLHVTSAKHYSARTRTLLLNFCPIDEYVIAATIQDPRKAIEAAQRQTESTKNEQASKGRTLRMVGAGLSAVAGGVLIGVTGGLAAPLVGASVTTLLAWLGFGGTAVGLLAGGLASSTVVCGAVFGAYGAHSSIAMVKRHTREIRDLDLVPVREPSKTGTLGVRLCISGWLSSPEEVTAPWKIFEGDDTFALQWEVEALKELSNALSDLLKQQSIGFLKAEVIKRTVFASLFSSLSPLALLNIGRIIDNPWMNAKALAVKAGAVLSELLLNNVFGKRPVTLIGYSLGSLVIFEALRNLAVAPRAKTGDLIQDVFLFGAPVPSDSEVWTSIRRLVSGRVVNGYASQDYVLAILSRVSSANWNVAGLQPVNVLGVENVQCEGVDGHTRWRELIGESLRAVGAPEVKEDIREK